MIKQLKKTTHLLLNPFVLAIVPTLVIIWLFPWKRDRYLLEEDNRRIIRDKIYMFYEDLTDDGYSEILEFTDYSTASFLTIRNKHFEVFDQWNFDGEFAGLHKQHFYITGDYDQNGEKEVYVFTQSNDSLFLQGIASLYHDTLFIEDRFVTTFGPGRNLPDPDIFGIEMTDLNGDGKLELIFGVTTGFSVFPRNIFAYYIEQDSVVMSPESYFALTDMILADVTGNGSMEILLSGYAPSNISPDDATYHDHSNWIMVLDQNLKFLFEPIEIPGQFSGIYTTVTGTEKKKQILVFHTSPSGGAAVYTLEPSGYIIQQQVLPGNPSHIIQLSDNNKVFWGLGGFDGYINVLDDAFKPKMTYHVDGIFFFTHQLQLQYHMGDDQITLMVSNETSTLHVFRNLLQHPVTAMVERNIGDVIHASVKLNGDESPQISLQLGNNHYLFSYGPNPMYYLNFGVYLLIYAGVLAFTIFTRSVQRRQIERQQQAEKRITELQMNLIRNQLDPHFTLNAINSIAEAVRSNQPDVAEEGLMRFASLHRHMVQSAGDIHRCLDEELSFTEDYLELERLRRGGSFNYEISVAPGIDRSLLIPRMLIHLHAENAVKHGLAPLKSDGLLRIEVTQLHEKLEILVVDNGVGREHSAKSSGRSTGLGLALMDDFNALYQKLFNQQISSYIRDLKTGQGKPAGTSVLIIIGMQYEPKRI